VTRPWTAIIIAPGITPAGGSKHRRRKEMIIYATPLPLTSETEKSYYA